MDDFDTAVMDLHRRQIALRGDCGILAGRLEDPNVMRLLRDMRDQHAQQAAEVSALVSARAAEGENVDIPTPPGDAVDGAAGDEHAPAVAEDPDPQSPPAALLQAVAEAESALLQRYEAAAAGADPRSPAFSLLRRHHIALTTSVQRLQVVAATAFA